MNFRKKVVAITVLAMALTSIVGLSALYASSAPPESPHYSYSECIACHSDRIDYHGNAGSHQYSDCISCHGDRHDDVSLYDAAHDQYFNGPHKTHLTSDQLSFECTQCHTSVDIREQSAASVRSQVSTGVCAECHSPFSKKMNPAWATQDCTTCHADWQSRHVSKPYINNANISTSDCIGCHGGRAWYLSGAAALQLSRNNIYWASYPDYVARHLSVNFGVVNTGEGTANDSNLTYVQSTNGVSVFSSLPASLGSLPQNGSSNFTVMYTVPNGVGTFRTTLYAQAVNDDDDIQYWPSAPPSP